MKFCRECCYNVIGNLEPMTGKYDKCTAPQSFTDLNLVTGEKVQKYHGFCEQLRSDSAMCGEAANWFTAKATGIPVVDILSAEEKS